MRPVDPRERWQTLQSHLSAARGALAARDKTAALEHIEAALQIDPEFLAARMLRDRVMSPEQDSSFSSSATQQNDLIDRRASASEPSTVSAPPPTVSPETLANFQERVMRRVREREAAADRAASMRPRIRTIAVPLAAAAGFLAAMSSTTLYEPRVLHSRSIEISASLITPDVPAPLVALNSQELNPQGPLTPTATPTERVAVAPVPAVRVPVHSAQTAIAMKGIVDVPPEPVRVPPAQASLAPTTTPQSPTQPTAPPATSTIARGVQVLPPRPAPDITVSAPSSTSAPAVVPVALVSTPDDRALVDQTLQRYRRAYNRLDARSAQAVYPAVNEHALARAFDDLESQVLLFESCVIDVQGRSANVTCRGSSHYVPKIGNHETRVERRVWSFRLHKDDDDWKIENARAAR